MNTEQLKKIEEININKPYGGRKPGKYHYDDNLSPRVKEFFTSSDEIKREVGPVLCFVEGDTAYFTTQSLSKQWGDDWNDAPYEHNAGTPYGYQSKDNWDIYTLKFDWDAEQPKDGHYNSPYSVEDINGGKVPWLKPSKWIKGGKNIYAGTTMQDFTRLITSTGGRIYRQLYEGDYLYLTQSKEGGE